MTDVKVIGEFKHEYWFLSNFSSSALIYHGRLWDTVEHLYQALKTTDEGKREVIRHAPDARTAKDLGGALKDLRPEWDAKVKFLVMEMCLRIKFHVDGPFYKKLCDTFPATLIEGNRWKDDIWGVRLDTGRGENYLGRLLMKIRAEYCEAY